MKNTSWRYSLAAGCLILVALLFLWFRLQMSLQARAQVPAHPSLLQALGQHGAPIGAGDAKYIEQWMTFDYLNTVFKLPADYFPTALSITGARYPYLSISRWAHEEGTSTSAALEQVRQAVRAYLASPGV